MKNIIFYTKPNCHLCEEGQHILAEVVSDDWSVTLCDISAHEDLQARYGERIPVLSRSGNFGELDWPFTAASIQAWLAATPQE